MGIINYILNMSQNKKQAEKHKEQGNE